EPHRRVAVRAVTVGDGVGEELLYEKGEAQTAFARQPGRLADFGEKGVDSGERVPARGEDPIVASDGHWAIIGAARPAIGQANPRSSRRNHASWPSHARGGDRSHRGM